MKVIITGAAGRLGSQTVKELVQDGYEVVATDRRENPHLPVKVEVVDLLDTAGVSAIIRGAEAVVHLGNHAGPWSRMQAQTFNENVAMDMNVFQAALETGARKVVFASSMQAMASEWVGDQPDQQPLKVAYLPMDGNSPANPTNTYALSKAVGEMMLRDFVARPGVDCVALRYPGMYHPHPDPAEMERHRHHHHHHHQHHAPSDVTIAQGFSHLSFPDASRLIDAILRSSLPGFRIYLPAISRGRGDRVPEFIEKHYKDVPLRKPIQEIASLIDISRITQETGWSPRDVPGI